MNQQSEGRTKANPFEKYEKELSDLKWRYAQLKGALNVANLFVNPDQLEEAADEIDCCPSCDHSSTEWDINCTVCDKSERGDYCPNDVAETLRAVAKVARAALAKTGETA